MIQSRSILLILVAAFSILILAIDVGRNFNVSNANQIEKGMVVVWALVTLWLGRINLFGVLGFFCITLIILISGINTDYVYYDYKTSLMSFTQIMALLFFFIAILDEPSLVSSLKVVSFAATISLVVGSVFSLMGYRELFRAEYATGILRLGGSTVSAFMAGLCIMSSISSLYLWLRYDKRFKYIFIISFICLLLTMGRMALFIGALLCYFRFLTMKTVSSRVKCQATLVLFFIGLIISAFILPSLIERMENSGSSGRDILWHFVMYMIEQYPDFGIGFGHQFLSTPQDIIARTASWSAHNEYLRITLELGVLPAIFFFIFLFLTLCSPMMYFKKIDAFYLFSVMLYMISCITDNNISSPHMFLFLVCSYYTFLLELTCEKK